jgi:hypothetical protein
MGHFYVVSANAAAEHLGPNVRARKCSKKFIICSTDRTLINFSVFKIWGRFEN